MGVSGSAHERHSYYANATSDELSSEGADGGPGVSCGFVLKGDYESTYNIVIKKLAT